MSIFQYFGLHRRQLRVKERVTVLVCLQFINSRRMRAREKAEADDVIVNQQRWRFIGGGQSFSGEGFNGVCAEEKLTAFELWRTICMYL